MPMAWRPFVCRQDGLASRASHAIEQRQQPNEAGRRLNLIV
jgi:hypothetical protein